MNLFELATLLAPVGGALGAATAVNHGVPSTPGWMWAAIPLGVGCGIACYRGLIRLSIGKYDNNSDMPGWRAAVILGIGFFAPLITGAISYGLMRLCLYLVA